MIRFIEDPEEVAHAAGHAIESPDQYDIK
jgi:hypothetical protein